LNESFAAWRLALSAGAARCKMWTGEYTIGGVGRVAEGHGQGMMGKVFPSQYW